jgi:hypothetical protein
VNLLDMVGGESHAPEPVCSRKGCRAPATTQLLWNNPKIHTPERRKVWLACEEHAAWLEDYLRSRSLWKETLPLTAEETA